MAKNLETLEKDSTALERYIIETAFKTVGIDAKGVRYIALEYLVTRNSTHLETVIDNINKELRDLGFQGRVTQTPSFSTVIWYLQTSLNRDMLRSICLNKLLESENTALWEAFKADQAAILKTQDLAYYCRYLEQGREGLADQVQEKAARYVF